MQSKIKICKTDFLQLTRRMWNKKYLKICLKILKSFGSKHDSAQQINCENFIIGCILGFRAILDQRQVFTTLNKNWIARHMYVSIVVLTGNTADK